MENGKLYVCATPIGNLEDITIRVLNTLKNVDLIAAEDTRHTIKLLNHYKINKPLTSYHEHNRIKKGLQLIEKLKKGYKIALVSDAGMPGISDPGEDIIRLCIENHIEIEVLPGASAVLTALVASGLSTDKFSFEGFLGRNKKKRRERLEKIKADDRTLVFYESPHRLINTLNDMNEILNDRQMVIARELTKKYEEIIRGKISDIINHFKDNPPKGEFVLLIEGSNIDESKEISFEDFSIEDHIVLYMNKGLSKKEAIKKVAKERNIPKKEVYRYGIEI
ncbi:16S rRNA (cytidine(1402)-2'-O)-methyltransferase [Paramaledivibacter caminithermalis]|jgi:16S rRNA (cytidine1402-2'-O)-methyltransferase|uniref:Ribosomal RNA small subunit methyltransferase I n=1 Tax=Paramaledivibacter caminithermalis (strain DSM 15212 / CIP 107654 / DViRD3) TaxID=1121301 RepID=A0A1M6QAC2_PARC5|nr:16S rRNA (cytidine(1402)-2'-O)-methyltransferase [Paramaledivibacter caminithermalis]SHK17192.1 16S rRNA (cytidine1402-2'-O)-methyltransferase [Paramaledivibacter caminithermalis DSM 15212]